MENKFVESARKQTTLSEVMEGRTKISVKEIISKYPEGVTLTEFDFITVTDPKKGESTFPVFAIKEDATICFFGGAILTNICKGWVDLYDGDVAEASAQLKEAGGVKVQMKQETTKAGNNITLVNVL